MISATHLMRRVPMSLALLALLTTSACASQGDDGPRVSAPASPGDRLATIGIAQALLHETDVLEGLGDRPAAIERAERVLTLDLAGDDPLREPLRLDARGRLAELRLAEGALDHADVAIEQGLGEVTARSYFEARLYVVRGRVLEARAAAHRAAQEPDLAEAELRAALQAHERSIEINEALLRSTTPAPEGATGEGTRP